MVGFMQINADNRDLASHSRTSNRSRKVDTADGGQESQRQRKGDIERALAQFALLGEEDRLYRERRKRRKAAEEAGEDTDLQNRADRQALQGLNKEKADEE